MCQKILSQPNFNPKQKLVWPHNAVEPTTPHKLLRYFQETQEPFVSNGRRPKFCSRQPKKMIFGMQPYFDPTRWNTEDDLNIFSNGRWPQFFSNGKWPQFCSRQPSELIFCMQHCFNPTRWNMEDDLNLFCKLKTTSVLFKWSYIKYSLNGRRT